MCIPPAKKKEIKDQVGNNEDNNVCSDNSASTSDVNVPNSEHCAENGHVDSSKTSDNANTEVCDKKKDLDNTESGAGVKSETTVSDKLDDMNISEPDSTKGKGQKVVETLNAKETESSADQEKDILTEEELVDLHMKADILHYLLPGICHLTAEEVPRRLLMESGALGVLDLYMWRQWEKLGDETRRTRETMVGGAVVCTTK